LQAEYNARINESKGKNFLVGYEEELDDLSAFVKVLRKVIPESALVVLHDRPEILLLGVGEGYEVSLFISGRCWRFKVNGSVNYTENEETKLAATRMLKRIWNPVIDNLPENFVVRGVLDPKRPPEEKVARVSLLGKLGFCTPHSNNEVYGVVKNKQMLPLTFEEFTDLTKLPPGQLNQKFNVKKIVWPGA
jgi:hypothetical protein